MSGLLFLYGFWEWTRLAGFTTNISRIATTLLMFIIPLSIVIVILFYLNPTLSDYDESIDLTVGVLFVLFVSSTLIFWVSMLALLPFFPKGQKFWKSKSLGLLAGFFALFPAFIAVNFLRWATIELLPLLYVLILIWTADIAAYYAGKRFGKHKLAPLISPGKSWEGVIGAFIAILLLASIIYYLISIGVFGTNNDIGGNDFLSKQMTIDSGHFLPFWYWLVLNIVTFIFSIVGDLFESAFKRVRHLKDSGNILPGHGGLLDRIDSLTSAAPIFAVGLVIGLLFLVK